MADHITRRGLMAALSGEAARSADRELLTHTLEVERLLVWSYERVLRLGRLGTEARRAVTAMLGHERQHVAILERLTGRRPPPVTLTAVRAELARHGVGASPDHLSTQHDCLRLLVDLESLAEGAWFGAVAKLADPGLASLGSRIMACQAQHWTILSSVAHHGDVKIAVPYPFVRGSSGY